MNAGRKDLFDRYCVRVSFSFTLHTASLLDLWTCKKAKALMAMKKETAKEVKSMEFAKRKTVNMHMIEMEKTGMVRPTKRRLEIPNNEFFVSVAVRISQRRYETFQ